MSVTFNGTDLETICTVSNVRRTLAQRDPELIDVPGMDGAILGLNDLQPLVIEMDLIVRGTPSARETTLRSIAALLNTEGLAQLQLSDDSGYYMAAASGGERVRYVDGEAIEGVTFTCPVPIMYGTQRTHTMASSSETITIGGNYPTRPVITCASATNSGGGVWGVQVDSGDYARVALAASAVAVEIDCEERTATEGLNTTLITLDSDWLQLAPGSRTIDLEGTGYPTLTWREMWI